MHAENYTKRRAQSENTATLSSGWEAVARWNSCETSIEPDGDDRRTADELLADELTARELLLIEAGLDPSLTDRERTEAIA